jgi:hypothetical protein
MAIEILIRSNEWPRETHLHRCPLCNPKQPFKNETNDLCQKTLKDTGLTYHVYPCLIHAADVRTRFGSDWLTSVLDAAEAARLTHVWPEARVQEREEREAQQNPEIAAVLEHAKKI